MSLPKTKILFLPVSLLLIAFYLTFFISPAYAGCNITTPEGDYFTPGTAINFKITGVLPNHSIKLDLIQVHGGNTIDTKTLTSDQNGEASFTYNAPPALGDYVWIADNDPRDCTPGIGSSPGFTVSNQSSGGINFVTFPAQVDNGRTTISIKVTGLDPNSCYIVKKVDGFTGNIVTQHNSPIDNVCQDFTQLGMTIIKSDDQGALQIENICENMEGARTDCTNPFDANKTYSFQVYKFKSGCHVIDLLDCFTKVGDPLSFTVSKSIKFPPTEDRGKELSGDTRKFVNTLVSFGIGIAGGVAFLLLIYGGFKFIFSLGNPEAVQQGREIITAALIGLIVVVFSVFLLRLVGISILGLPL